MRFFNFIDKRFKKKHTEFNHKKFIIPVNDLTRKEAESQIKDIMKFYKEIIVFDVKDKIDEIVINGDIKIPFQKEYWFPVNSLKNSQK
jgi:hypothetical protein